MTNKDFFLALDELEKTKGISKATSMEWIENALVVAYKKNYGEGRNILAKIDDTKNTIKIYATRTIVADGEVEDQDTQIALSEARLLKKSYKVGDLVKEEITPKDFGRIAAGAAKQVFTQKFREAERSSAFKEMSEKLEQIVTGIIRRVEKDTIYLELVGSQIEGVLMANDQIPGERYQVNDRLKVFVKKLRETARGTQAIVSRSVPQFVKKLFELEIPEIASGVVQIKGCVREAGYRSKIAVYSEDKNIDPLGACVGNKGTRVNNIVSELGGEKIDIIIWSEDPFEYIARALSPAKVLTVEVYDEVKSARVIVPDDKLSLAIGKSGQNVRLAAKLTNWKIDVKSVSQSVQPNEDMGDNISDSAVDAVKTNFGDINSMFEDVNLDGFKDGEE